MLQQKKKKCNCDHILRTVTPQYTTKHSYYLQPHWLLQRTSEHTKPQRYTRSHHWNMSYFFKIAQKRIEIRQSKSQTMTFFFYAMRSAKLWRRESADLALQKTQNPKTFHCLHPRLSETAVSQWSLAISNTVNGLINALRIYLIFGVHNEAFKRDGGTFILKTVTSSTKLICFRQKYQGGNITTNYLKLFNITFTS